MDYEMCVELLGYSERGMVNALCYDLQRSGDVRQVEAFLEWFDFSHLGVQPRFQEIRRARLIVEQSFSVFGVLDLLILLEHEPPYGEGRPPEKQVVLIEAKVSTDTDNWQTVDERFRRFSRLVGGGEENNSNLFVQLHRKVRLVEYLRNQGGVFIPDLLTPLGTLGDNHVVTNAGQELANHVRDGGEAWFAAILPDAKENLAAFAQGPSHHDGFAALPPWDVSRLGFLSWRVVQEQVNASPGMWPHTVSSFVWNAGQIFRDDPPIGREVQPGGVYLHRGRNVFVVPARMGVNCRVALLEEGAPDFFWTTKTASQAELEAIEGPASPYLIPVLPTIGRNYSWVDRQDGLPETAEPHPPSMANETSLVIIGPSWGTSRVRPADASEGEPSFLVHTHYLRRNPVTS